MKVILLKDTSNLGKRGDVKDVADAYALNVLIKKQIAIQATPQELLKWKQKEDSKKHKKELETSIFAQVVDKIRNNPIVIEGKKHDAKGQLFAQVKEGDIADAIFAVTKISIDPKQVIIPVHIKNIGTHSVELKQSGSVEKITVTVK